MITQKNSDYYFNNLHFNLKTFNLIQNVYFEILLRTNQTLKMKNLITILIAYLRKQNICKTRVDHFILWRDNEFFKIDIVCRRIRSTSSLI